MFFVHPIASLLSLALQILTLFLWAYFILSLLEFWQQISPRTAPRISTANPLVRGIERVAYSVLHPIRRVIEPYQRGTGFDFSIVIALIVIGILQRIVSQLPF